MSAPSSNHRPPPRRPVAVALKYEPGAQSLPRIVATGKGHVADQILELAFANGVKVREDADLVQILSAVDIDSEIPIEAIAAVAEILAYVYRANGTLPPSSEPAPESTDNAKAPVGASPIGTVP
ncbi:EscU/YscU/HrcU family type III secretion system export apparatus switch protein [Azospirillum canadense]|uniref:EscU/YscU/HrcU family type III secretion system export apparatus switch protein n=1 Tax=Azospirillum canadense TaxID=403962 RepID=UPI0022280AD3|nr:EscU/YscU/HrcU family type III secretion system export apparatus switch protein [Azospirillum canadense]MCW2237386.1 flagellar biosynthesis protein [Azospirillum canadense]